jgi:hypothetical protein
MYCRLPISAAWRRSLAARRDQRLVHVQGDGGRALDAAER